MNNENLNSGRGRILNPSAQFDMANGIKGELNETQVRSIVQDEMMKNYRSGAPIVPPHRHNEVDNLRINQVDIIPAIRTSGSITFAHTGQYILGLNGNPNPTLILCYGTVVDNPSSPTIRVHTMGSACLGPSLYQQPQSNSSTVTGGPLQPFIQSSSYISEQGTTQHALTDEGHLVDVEYPISSPQLQANIHARLTLVSYNRTTITLNVDNLDAGWNIIVNLIII